MLFMFINSQTARQQILGAGSDKDLITFFSEKNDSKNILIAEIVLDVFGKGTYGLNSFWKYDIMYWLR